MAICHSRLKIRQRQGHCIRHADRRRLGSLGEATQFVLGGMSMTSAFLKLGGCNLGGDDDFGVVEVL